MAKTITVKLKNDCDGKLTDITLSGVKLFYGYHFENGATATGLTD